MRFLKRITFITLIAYIIDFVILSGTFHKQVGDALLKLHCTKNCFKHKQNTQTHCSLTVLRKCCVGGCNSNYDTGNEYLKAHPFPSDPDEKPR